MISLTIDPTYRVLLGEVIHFRILLVGVGGTGSALAQALAGLAHHARDKAIKVEITLMDPDIIEPQNVGRQQFGAAAAMHSNVPKAADLALRLNAAYGLNITAWPLAYTYQWGAHWLREGSYNSQHIIIGCVDNHLGRQKIADTVAAIHFDPLGLCTALPSPYLQEPNLLESDTTPEPASCAELAWRDEQSLMINRLTAAVAGHYLTNFILWRQVVQMGTVFNLEPTVMAPKQITREAVATVFTQPIKKG